MIDGGASRGGSSDEASGEMIDGGASRGGSSDEASGEMIERSHE
jgi:hypothetical protein